MQAACRRGNGDAGLDVAPHELVDLGPDPIGEMGIALEAEEQGQRSVFQRPAEG